MSLIARITALAQAVGADIKSVKAQISAAATALAANVRSTVLTGLSTATATAVLATDTVLAAIGKIQGRLNALGTAANANLTTSTTDTTAGSVVKVGDFGANGGSAIALATGVNWDTITTPGEYFVPGASGINAPAAINLYVQVVNTAAGIKQIAYQYGAANLFSRYVASGTWSAWSRVSDNLGIVGTVVQSGGLPTIASAIIETGTNANGRYTKFADGTIVMQARLTATYVSTTDLSIFWTFPASCTAIPAVNVTPTLSWTPAIRAYNPLVRTQQESQSNCLVAVTSPTGGLVAGDSLVVNVTAIGKWN